MDTAATAKRSVWRVTASLAVLCIGAATAAAEPALIALPKEPLRSSYPGWTFTNAYRQITPDGEAVYGWSYSRGGPILWNSEAGIDAFDDQPHIPGTGGIGRMSPDRTTFFGYAYVGPLAPYDEYPHFLWHRPSDTLTLIGSPRGGSGATKNALFAPSGKRFAGDSLIETFDQETRVDHYDPHAWTGTAEDGFQALSNLPVDPADSGGHYRYGSTVIGVTDDGAVFGNTAFAGEATREFYDATRAAPRFALRWRDAKSAPEILTGTMPNGDTWTMSRLIDVSDDGSRWLGEARITREVDGAERLVEEAVQAVFSDRSAPWILGSIDSGTGYGPAATHLSGDGTTVIGSRKSVRGSAQPVALWTEAGGEVSLDHLFSRLGILFDTRDVRGAIDLSRDGQRILLDVREHLQLAHSNPERRVAYLLIIPEPSASALLAVGLCLLARQREPTRSPFRSRTRGR